MSPEGFPTPCHGGKSFVIDGDSTERSLPSQSCLTPLWAAGQALIDPQAAPRPADLHLCLRAGLDSDLGGNPFSPCCEGGNFTPLREHLHPLCQGCTSRTPCPELLKEGTASKARAKGTAEPKLTFPLLDLKRELLLSNPRTRLPFPCQTLTSSLPPWVSPARFQPRSLLAPGPRLQKARVRGQPPCS